MKVHSAKNVCSLTLASIALAATGCGRGSNDAFKYRGPTQQQIPSITEIKIEDASESLLQNSVARLVTQLEVNGKKVLVYQDSYSSFYDRLSSSDRQLGRVPASLIYYYTPHFVAGLLDATKLPNGNIELKIQNKTSLRTMMDQIRADLREKIGDSEEKSQLMQLPVSDVRATVRVFGKEYPVQMASDFSQAIVVVSPRELPQAIHSTLNAEEIRKGMNLFSIKYNYWVLPFNEDQCSLGIDTKVLKNAFVAPNSTESPEPQPAHSENNASSVLTSVGRPVTIDMTRKAVELARKSMDARCTSSAGGMGWDSIGKLLNRLFEKGTDYVLDPSKTNDWDNVFKTIVGEAMKPDAFRSAITNINNQLNQGKSLAQAFNSSADSQQAAKTLIEIDSSASKQLANAKNRSSNTSAAASASYGLFSGEASGAHADSSSSTDSSAEESVFHNRNINESAEQYANKVNRVLNESGHSMQLTDVSGNLQIVPKVRITLTNELNMDESILAGLKATQLGVLKQERGEVGADIEPKRELSLAISVQCDENLSRRVVDLQSSTWTLDPNKAIASALSGIEDDLKLASKEACRQVLVSMSIAGDTRLIPESLSFNINASKTATETEESRLFSNAISLSPKKPTETRTFGTVSQNPSSWSTRIVVANAH